MTNLIYTDGSSYIAHPDKLGGYGVLIQEWEKKVLLNETELRCGYSNTTVSRMELLAICVALESAKLVRTWIVSDSQYCVNSINLEWVFGWETEGFPRRVKNSDLWKRFLEAYRRFPEGMVKFIHTRGHGKGDPRFIEGNNRVDELAAYAEFDEYVMDVQE